MAVPGLALAMLSFQTGASLAKSLFPLFGALGMTGLRVGLASAMLCALWRPWRQRYDRQVAIAVVQFGLSIGMMNACFYEALARLPLGVAVSIEFLGPLSVAIAGSRRWLDVAWAVLAAAGLAMLLGGIAARPDPVGVGFALLSALFWGAYITTGVRVGRVMRAGPATAAGMLVAACLVVPAGLGAMGPLLGSASLLAAAFGVAMLSSALPYIIEVAAMRRMSARGFGVLMSAEPALAALSGLVLLGERLALVRWVGVGLIVAASAGSVLFGERAIGGRLR